MENRTTIDALARWLAAQDRVALIGHVSPDGDTAGSCMALMLALRAMGKRAFVCLPGGMPKMYGAYPCADETIQPGETLPFEPEAALAVDVSEKARMGAAAALFDGCAQTAALDHHATNPGFGDLCLVDGDRAATGELALELIDALGVALTAEMATWLYIAISTDSGHFSFSSTTSATMRAAARLIEAGVDVAELTRALYRTRSQARTRLLGAVLNGLEVSADGQMAWARLTDEMLSMTGATREDNEGVVNYLLEIEGVEFAALAEERAGATKFSLRSKRWLDVAQQVARPFGGGGHARAAGCTLDVPMEEALRRVLDQARAALEAGRNPSLNTNGMKL